MSIKAKSPKVVSLGDRVRAGRHAQELENVVEALERIGVPGEQARELVARVGTVAVATTLQGTPPLWLRAAGPVRDLETAIAGAREKGVRITGALVHPADLQTLAEAAGYKAIIGPDGRPLGAPPSVTVAGVPLHAWPAIAQGWATLVEAVFVLLPGAQAPAEGGGE